MTFRAPVGELPDRVLLARASDPARAYLKSDGETYAWSFAGYSGAESPPPAEEVVVLTPRPTVDVIRAGFGPSISGFS